MTVTVASFRKDFATVFGSKSQYPDGVIAYWIAMAQLLLGIGTGATPTICSFTGSIGAGGNPNTTLTVSEINFGSINPLPLLVEGEDIANNIAILAQLSGDPAGVGTYQLSAAQLIAAENMVAFRAGIGTTGNPFWGPSSLTPDAPPTTIADFATEMWVAHQIVLEKQAMAAAQSGGDPGTKIGVINNKSVNGVSVGFDVAAVTGSGASSETAGYYNQTFYGQRFWRLAYARSAGPIQIGIGRAPLFLVFNNWGYLGSSNAWGGPYPGVQQGDSGFGS